MELDVGLFDVVDVVEGEVVVEVVVVDVGVLDVVDVDE